MLAYFFLTAALQENMKHQQAVWCIGGKKRLPACSKRAKLFPLKSVGMQVYVCVCVLSHNEGGEDGKGKARTGLTF